MIPFLLTNIRYVAAGFMLLVLVGIGWQINQWRNDAKITHDYQDGIRKLGEDIERAAQIGTDAENANVTYKQAATELDKELHNAPVDTTARFNADSVRRTAARIAAGEAARKQLD